MLHLRCHCQDAHADADAVAGVTSASNSASLQGRHTGQTYGADRAYVQSRQLQQATNATSLPQVLRCCPACCFDHALTVMVWLGLHVRFRLTTNGASAVLADTQVDGIVPHWASWVPAGAKAGVGGRDTAGPVYAGLSATPRGRTLDESPGLGEPEPAGRQRWFRHSHPEVGHWLSRPAGGHHKPDGRCQSRLLPHWHLKSSAQTSLQHMQAPCPARMQAR